MALYLMSAYANPRLRQGLEKHYRSQGKKLDMGKCCLRFKTLDEVPLNLVGEVIAATGVDEYIALYEASRSKRI